MAKPERLSVFDAVADLYDRVRPTYPDALIDDLIALSSLPDGGRVLEIGCGTGQLTCKLARRGHQIDAVELGPSLATIARGNLATFPRVTLHVGAFEEWPLPPEPYDLVVSATAFHWIDPAVRFEKTARALRPGGALAVVETHHVSGRDDAFFHEVQRCYERHMPGTPPNLTLPAAATIEPSFDGPGVEQFAPPQVRTYPYEATYATTEYVDVLNTYSGHIELPAADRTALLACVRELLDGRFGGHIRKQYLFTLITAQLQRDS